MLKHHAQKNALEICSVRNAFNVEPTTARRKNEARARDTTRDKNNVTNITDNRAVLLES